MPPSHTGPGRRALALAAALALTGADRAEAEPVDRGAVDRAAEGGAVRDGVRRTARAARRQGAIELDGRLDDSAWAAAEPQSGFWQRDPHPGRPPVFRTEFRVLYDDEAVYVCVRAHDPEPARIRRLLTRRDVDSPSDWIYVALDSYFDRRTAFAFGINAAGVQRDMLLFNDVEEDPSWEAVWEAKARIDEEGWVAEFRIPYSQLRFSGEREQVWGMQVMRVVQRSRETSLWSPWPKESSQHVSLYGTLTGLSGISPGRRLELLPYVLGGARLYAADDGDPFHDGVDGLAGAGLDLKVGIGPSATVSATINPDFGQVEADPSQVNLGAGEVFFQEKRPFFLEGIDIFRFSLGQGDGDSSVESLFYTRRIGAPPRGQAVGDHVEAPGTTTIYGAAKLSGKSGGWSYGLLDAVTGQEDALVATDGVDGEERVIVEPLTNYAVGRGRKDLRGGATSVGLAATSVHRSLDGTGLSWLHEEAYTGGLELSHRFWDEEWAADLRLAGSHVRGSAEAIDRTQRASQRYYQRPDADHLDYDPTRTSLSGTAWLWSFGRMAGRWRFTVGGDGRTPGFEVNDLGFQRSADYYVQWLWGQYREIEPGEVLLDWGINHNAWSVWNLAGDHLNLGGNFNGWVNLRNHWGANGGVGVNVNRLDPTYLRGGPMVRRDPGLDAWGSVFSSSNHRVYGTLSASGFQVPASHSHGYNLSGSVTVVARSNLDVSLGPVFSVLVDDNQYVGEVTDADGEAHQILGRLRQVTTALTLRASYTFSPALSLQLYAQPFVSGGRFTEYKEPVAPRAGDYDDRYHTFGAGETEPVDDETLAVDRDGDGAADFSFSLADFNVRELRSNLVMRWEYRPGSTLFLIWSHGRTSQSPDGRFLLGEDLSALADEPGEHVLLAKINYWF